MRGDHYSMRRKMWIGLALTAVMLVVTACGGGGKPAGDDKGKSGAAGDKDKVYNIAISQIVEHPSLDATREGFIAALKDAGYEEGKNLKIDYNNAQNEMSNIETIAKKIAESKSDLALGIATPSAVSMSDIKDFPVLFAAVTDPIAEKIVSQLKAPGGNITGAADTNPESIVMTMDFIAAEFPNVKTVGVVINKGESNAVVMAKVAEEALAKHNIKLIEASITNTSEVQQAAESLVGRADAIYVTLDNKVVSAIDAVIEVANKNDIPFFSADRDTVESGAFAAVGFKYFDHGYEVGQMAVEILKGKKPGEMDVTIPQKLDFIMNLKAAAEQGITVTDKMKSYVKDPENNILE